MSDTNPPVPNQPDHAHASDMAQARKGALLGLLLFLLVIIGFTLWKTDIGPRFLPKLFFTSKTPTQPIVPANTVQTTPVPLPAGKQTYIIRGPGGKSEISEITLDPLDPQLGEIQEVSVKTDITTTITNISITIITEQGEVKHGLGRSGESSGSAIWTGSWPTTQLHDKLYGARIDVTTDTGTKPIDLWFR